ncbi:MAG TPA: ChaN family lipoprotein [Thermomonas sp.]|jgi:uncharacterized iron-regulated protein|uniref:ChaN family lipoprotein n=1 Tax=Thermomonas sp. TaxID=1971895 RepID=UPI002BDCC616|nr:ChaN family lipoprotein [Thermomonas sp.]HOV96867.1 ChaN family lipoprotein [Thermomonas sp.]
MLRNLSLLALLSALLACSHTPTPVAIATPRVLLLGEVHDNAAGHAARIAVLREKLATGWRPAIAMEQFDRERQSDLDAAMRDCTDADCVIARAAPAKSSWEWTHYKPVIELARQYQLPLYAANLSRAAASNIVRAGFADALPADLIAHYRLDALPVSVLAAQSSEVRDSHCGQLPEAMVVPMAKAQIARDVVMADVIRTALHQHAAGIVLIAGNGHVRSDIAVPFWLHRAGLTPSTLGFLEPNANAAPYDAVQRIPASARPDPCAGFTAPKPAG